MNPERIGACTLGLRMLELEPALDELARLGYKGVDLWQVSPYYKNKGHVAGDAPPEERGRVRKLASDRGLRLHHLASYPGIAFGAENPDERQRDLAWAKQTVDLCADLRIPVMRIGTGRGETLDRLPVAAPLLRQAADYADARGVRLGLETHRGTPTCKADWVQAVLDAAGSRNLGVLYDPGNLALGQDYRDVPRKLADRIFHVHLKNVRLSPDGKSLAGGAGPTDGAVDIVWVLDALADSGYKEAIAVEYEAHPKEATLENARQGLAEWLDFLLAH